MLNPFPKTWTNNLPPPPPNSVYNTALRSSTIHSLGWPPTTPPSVPSAATGGFLPLILSRNSLVIASTSTSKYSLKNLPTSVFSTFPRIRSVPGPPEL